MTLTAFTKNPDNYYRDYNIVKDGIEQYAIYLHKATNVPKEQCLEWLKAKLKEGKELKLVDPVVQMLRRDTQTGDRELIRIKFTTLINDIKSRNLILSPSFTALLPSSVRVSLSGIYMNRGKRKRKEYKDKQKAAERVGDAFLTEQYKANQTKAKTDINSLSGVRAMPNTPLYVRQAHPILSSGCRVTVSYTNAINERMVAGNRHYWSPNIVIAEIAATLQMVNLDVIQQVMTKYKLRYPTVDDCMSCIKRGSEMYWYSPHQIQMNHLRVVVSNLTALERAAYLYVNDFYHLAMCNRTVAETILLELSKNHDELPPAYAPTDVDYVKQLSDPQDIFLKTIVYRDIQHGGKSLEFKVIAQQYPELYAKINNVAKNIIDTMVKYDDFFYAFFMTRLLPLNISMLPEIVRRAVPGSDTDSSIFTVEDWSDAMALKYPNRDRVGIANSIVYLCDQSIAHNVALSCGNMGIEKKNMFLITMKNEFFFPILSLTNNAKHYYAYQQFKDGGLLPKLEEEIKGAGLKDSKLPAHFKAGLKKFISNIMDAYLYGIDVSIEDVFTDIYNLEVDISNSILAGKCDYLKRDIIKDNYSDEKRSKLIHARLWKTAFATKYGEALPPYRAIKLPLDTRKSNKLLDWIAGVSDRNIAANIKLWLEEEERENGVKMLLFPEYNLVTVGIPDEIRSVIDIRSTQIELMMSFYMVLESLGLFLKGKSIEVLVSDIYKPIPGTSMHAKVDAYKKSKAA